MSRFDEQSESTEPSGDVRPAELDALYVQVRSLAPLIIVSLAVPFPPDEPYLRLAYRHQGGQIIFDADTGLYLWRATRKVVGRPERATAAALAVAGELGAPVV